ncbi:MAG TPA: GNAT family protein [Aestuariivirgaceae bacterium]|jgi:RimJ/RimL family protein N-acetyltransferase
MTMQPERPVGPKVEPLPAGAKPDGRPLFGRYVLLEKVSAGKHAHDLYRSFAGSDPEGNVWTYMGYGPFDDLEQFTAWLAARETSADPLFHAFVPKTEGRAAGMGAFMRHDGTNGVIEIGHIWLSPALQRTREATESIYLMMRHAFEDLGVRRLEWKCDALNEPSRRAAKRYGFTFEGVFRQHMIVKGRNRDTAWFSMIDKEWPPARQAFDRWLDLANFDAGGRQKMKLKVPQRQGPAGQGR